MAHGRLVDSMSLFVPMLNEESNIDRVVQSSLTAVEAVARVGEVIIVNDGSSDQTGVIADRLASAHAHVRVVHHVQNRGYGAAQKSGYAAALALGAQHIVLLHGDEAEFFEALAEDFDEIRALLRRAAAVMREVDDGDAPDGGTHARLKIPA